MTPQLNRLPFPLPQKIKKKKGNIWVRTNERTNNRIESNRPETRNKKRRDLPILAILLYMLGTLIQKRFYLPLSRCLTHARTHNAQVKHTSIHSSLTTSHRKLYLPAIKGNLGHGIRGRPTSQREREKYSFCLGPITEYDFISPQHASYQHAAAADDDENDENDDGCPTNYIALHPTRSSFLIHPFN